jgi:hypothetical protein
MIAHTGNLDIFLYSIFRSKTWEHLGRIHRRPIGRPVASHVVFALDVLFPVECFGGVVYFGSDTLVWVVIVEDLPQQVKKGEKFLLS